MQSRANPTGREAHQPGAKERALPDLDHEIPVFHAPAEAPRLDGDLHPSRTPKNRRHPIRVKGH
jgi:hypothetical protein